MVGTWALLMRSFHPTGNCNSIHACCRTRGLLYFKGLGVPQNYAIAHMWLNLGADSGNEEAANYRDALTAKMAPTQIAEAQRLAHEWKPAQR